MFMESVVNQIKQIQKNLETETNESRKEMMRTTIVKLTKFYNEEKYGKNNFAMKYKPVPLEGE